VQVVGGDLIRLPGARGTSYRHHRLTAAGYHNV
jgi:hypothetical protein